MKIPLYGLVMILSLALAFPAGAENEWPEGSAMHVGGIHREKHDYFMGFLKKDQAKLEELVRAGDPDNERLLRAVQDQHAAWLEYYPHECELVGALSGAGGSWPSTYAMQCMANLVNNRMNTVRNATRCIKREPEKSRLYSMSACLYQLGPMTIK